MFNFGRLWNLKMCRIDLKAWGGHGNRAGRPGGKPSVRFCCTLQLWPPPHCTRTGPIQTHHHFIALSTLQRNNRVQNWPPRLPEDPQGPRWRIVILGFEWPQTTMIIALESRSIVCLSVYSQDRQTQTLQLPLLRTRSTSSPSPADTAVSSLPFCIKTSVFCITSNQTEKTENSQVDHKYCGLLQQSMQWQSGVLLGFMSFRLICCKGRTA